MQHQDPVVAILDPYVRSGAVRPEHASRMYDELAPLVVERADTETQPPDRAVAMATGAVALATGLALAGVLVAVSGRSMYEPTESFSIKTALESMGAVVAFVGVAVVTFLKGDTHHRQIAGIAFASAGLLLSMALLDMADDESMTYASGGLLLISGVAGYVWLRRPVVALVAVLGAGQLFLQIFTDVAADSDPTSGTVLLWGMVGAVFGLAVVAIGWKTAAHRMLFAAGAGVAFASLATVPVVLSIMGAFLDATADVEGYGEYSGGMEGAKTDATLACVLGLVVTVGCLAVYVLRRHNAGLVMTWVGAATFAALIPVAQGMRHPVIWGGAIALVGVIVAATAVAVGILRRS